MTRRSRNFIAFLAAGVAVTGLVVAFTLGEPTDATTPDTTVAPTTAPTTAATTTVPIHLEPAVTEIATGTAPIVEVWRELPTLAADSLNPAATDAAIELAAQLPHYSTLRPNAEAIPAAGSPVVGRRATDTGWEFDHPTPQHYELTFVVTENHGEWLKVLLPVRPNGTQGWVHTSQVRTSTIHAHVAINLAERRLVATVDGTVIADTPVVIGAADTPTPTGRLFLTHYDEKSEGSAYGPWVAALSGFSQALDRFSGGVPVIAIHGTNNPAAVGQARSNGCIRIPNDVIRVLRDSLPLGTPVDIWP